MKNILTAEESFTKSTGCIINHRDVKIAMIEFAKMHVEAALKAAADNLDSESCFAYSSERNRYDELSDSILNSYSLENIK